MDRRYKKYNYHPLRFLPHPPFATFDLIVLYMAASVGMTCLFYDKGGE